MAVPEPGPWQKLFGAPEQDDRSGSTRCLHLVRRNGKPFLLLPRDRKLAARGMELYAAQSATARVGKTCLRFALRLGWPAGLNQAELKIAEDDLFARYLMRVAQPAAMSLPPFALLTGNPHTEGQRCIFLLFDEVGSPAAVVKAGAGVAATRLIESECRFLRTIPSGTQGVPVLRSEFSSDRVRAFATDYFPGRSPKPSNQLMVEKILTSWIQTQSNRRISDSNLWRRLQACEGLALPKAVKTLDSIEVRPCIFHGDFAPWNIKDHDGVWTMIDWERGELEGLPGWDWFHFVVQTAILVEKASSREVLERLETLFAGAEFQRYARLANLTGLERPMALAYVEYNVRVLRPSEGLSALRELATQMEKAWFAKL